MEGVEGEVKELQELRETYEEKAGKGSVKKKDALIRGMWIEG